MKKRQKPETEAELIRRIKKELEKSESSERQSQKKADESFRAFLLKK